MVTTPEKKILNSTQVKKVHLDYKLDGIDMNFNFAIDRRREIRAAISIFETAIADLKEILKDIPSQED